MIGFFYKKRTESIDHFQFENLINNAIPFRLFLISGEVPSNVQNKHYLEQILQKKTYNETLKILSQKEDLQLPIVIVAKNHSVAAKLVYKMNKLGYNNCYWYKN